MKPMKTLVAILVCLLLTACLAGSALAWGDAPTHFSIGNDLLKGGSSLPAAVTLNPEVFVVAAAAPDLAWTTLFRSLGLTYVHSTNFAKSLLAVAGTNAKWRAMAYAWGAHLAADAEGERSTANPDGFIPPEEPLHQLVEVAVDTVIFYDHANFPPPAGFPSWAQVNVSFDPWLLYQASIHYSRTVKRVPLVWPWVAIQALQGLKTTITAEYDYIKLKQSPELSQAFLASFGDWRPAYNASAEAAAAWIAANK